MPVMCQYEPDIELGGYTCTECNDHRTKLVHRECDIAPSGLQVVRSVSYTPGRALKAIIVKDFGVSPCARCHETAAKMDRLGLDGCRERLHELAAELHANAVRLDWRQLLEAAKHPRWSQVTGAVRAVAQGREFFASLILEACEKVEDHLRKGSHG